MKPYKTMVIVTATANVPHQNRLRLLKNRIGTSATMATKGGASSMSCQTPIDMASRCQRDRPDDHDADQDDDRQVPLHTSWRLSHSGALLWPQSGASVWEHPKLPEIPARVCGAAGESGRRQFSRRLHRIRRGRKGKRAEGAGTPYRP